MTIYNHNGKLEIISEKDRTIGYIETETGDNGKMFVPLNSVSCDYFHITEGNEKTGKAWNYNMSIELTCSHACECYKKGLCYACSGCYQFTRNQMVYTENVAYFFNHSIAEIVETFQFAIDCNPTIKLFRFFTCGDIPNSKFIKIMVKLAINNPDIEFWTYTKKYQLINTYIDEHGNLPDNLTVIFSHWLNSDGSYFPMNNPNNMPTSEFIPIGQEDHINVTHICPCSDPSVISTCATCEHPCYRLKHGQSMALLEHSTSATKQRDREIKAAKKALKTAKK